MPEWEREYARLRAQQSIGAPARVLIALTPYPSVRLECVTCEIPMFGNPETQRWECPECGVSEMTDGEVARLLVACSELLKSKMIDIGIVMEAPVTEPVEETWSQALKNKFKQ